MALSIMSCITIIPLMYPNILEKAIEQVEPTREVIGNLVTLYTKLGQRGFHVCI